MKKFLIKCGVMLLATAPMMQAYAADAFDGAKIYGYIYSGTAGVYEVFPGSVELKFQDTGYASDRMYTAMSAGWLEDGKFCGYAPDAYGTSVYDNYYIEFDWETGEQLVSKKIPTASAIQFGAVDPSERTIYGFGISGGKQYWLSSSVSDPELITAIAEVKEGEWCLGITYNYDDFCLVGLRKDGTLVKISKDGAQQTLFDTKLGVTSTTAGLVYAAGKVYISIMNGDYVYSLYVADLATNTVSQFEEFPNSLCRFLILGEAPYSNDAPGAPVINTLEFPWGSADGKASLTMPSSTLAGETISESLSWFAEVDGAAYADGTAMPGADVDVEFKNIATGSHLFSFYTKANDLKGKSAEQTLYIGHDTPATPANVTLTETTVSWDAVTVGAHGGYVDTEALKYTVCINGEEIGTTSETQMALPESGNTALRVLTATVTATAGDLTSAPGTSQAIVVGEALELPVFLKPTAEDFALCTTVDYDQDSKTWTYNSTEEAFYSGYNVSAQMDDWLILPPVQLDADNIYYLSFDARRMRSFFDAEALEVYIGSEPSPEALIEHRLVDYFQPEVAYKNYTAEVNVPEDGKWYVAFRCVSQADQSGVYVCNVALSANGVTASSPAAVTNLKATAGAEGALEASVSFRFPEKTVGGDDLDPATELSAIVKGANEITVKGLPGEEASATVATLQGDNTITVTTVCGEANGPAASVEVYTGVSIPGAVTGLNTAVAADMMSVTLSWTAPESSKYDFFRPEELTYNIYQMQSTLLGDMWVKVAENVTETSYTFTAEELNQECYELAVTAANEAGESGGMETTLAVLGTPWELPMADTFDTSSIYTYEPWVICTPTPEYTTQWGPLPKIVLPFLSDDDSEGNAICGMGLSENCLGRAGFPVFSTAGTGENVALQATFWTGESSTPDIRILGLTHGMEEPVEVGVVNSNGTWNTISFPLPESLLNKEWVALYLQASFPLGTAQWLVMDDYSISAQSSVSDIATDNVSVIAGKGLLTITAPATSKYVVASIDGTVAALGEISEAGTIALNLNSGIYIVNVNGTCHKVSVK